MSITELDLFVQEIHWTYDTLNLTALRAKFHSMLKKGHISLGLYHGLNKEIRNRSDWLKQRGSHK